jgi:NDP-sugar pyrophosphorylase family protein
VDAVVMAAGEGRRLRPLTDHWPKPILPIGGRPVILTLLQELAEGGCERAWIVTGHLAEQVERLVDRSQPTLEIRFVRQPEPLGSADVIARAIEAGAEPTFMVSAADTVYQPGDLARVARTDGAAVAWRRRPRGAKTLTLEGERVVEVPGDPASGHFAAPLWIVTAEIVPFLQGLSGPPFELSHAFQRAIDAGTTVRGVEIGPTRDLTEPADLVRHNFLYLAKSDE